MKIRRMVFLLSVGGTLRGGKCGPPATQEPRPYSIDAPSQNSLGEGWTQLSRNSLNDPKGEGPRAEGQGRRERGEEGRGVRNGGEEEWGKRSGECGMRSAEWG